jgi:hypothetical protein
MAGKGSKSRKVDQSRFDANHDGISWNSQRKSEDKNEGTGVVAEIKALVAERCTWRCECNGGTCLFASEDAAKEGSHGKFCGRGASIRKKGSITDQ